MPLLDNPEFLAWQAQFQDRVRMMGDRPSARTSCEECGVADDRQPIIGGYCLTCLAGMFAVAQTYQRIATVVHQLAAAAGDSETGRLADLLESVVERLEDAITDQAHR